ncbi:hypothetical protein [Moritella sp.]|uniref:TA system antitoxin ParD family protein n=1 Tax=Moritella sp. TaxID=78556 RepID=UPI0025FDB822|nr:hypothetical protein [Moritella sp.]
MTFNIRTYYKCTSTYYDTQPYHKARIRSINSQAEFWMKIGMLAELHPQLSFNQIIADLIKSSKVSISNLTVAEGSNDEQ